jgi:hypothetical protein
VIADSVIMWALGLVLRVLYALPVVPVAGVGAPSLFWCAFATDVWGPVGGLLAIWVWFIGIYVIIWVLKRIHILGGG